MKIIYVHLKKTEHIIVIGHFANNKILLTSGLNWRAKEIYFEISSSVYILSTFSSDF